MTVVVAVGFCLVILMLGAIAAALNTMIDNQVALAQGEIKKMLALGLIDSTGQPGPNAVITEWPKAGEKVVWQPPKS